jgi:pilus assembly protein Flp/PilA
MKSIVAHWAKRFCGDNRGGVFVEYLLLLTIVGIGVIAGLATLRGALLNELLELAEAIAGISP